MRQLQVWQILLIGFVLLLVGFLIPFLTLVRVIPASFGLLFLSYAAQAVGLMLGLIGAAWYVSGKRKKP